MSQELQIENALLKRKLHAVLTSRRWRWGALLFAAKRPRGRNQDFEDFMTKLPERVSRVSQGSSRQGLNNVLQELLAAVNRHTAGRLQRKDDDELVAHSPLAETRKLLQEGDHAAALLSLGELEKTDDVALQQAAAALEVQCLYGLRLYGRAIARFEELLGPPTPALLRTIGPIGLRSYVRSLVRLNELEAAEVALRMAQVERPLDGTLYEELAVALQRRKPALALEQLEHARTLGRRGLVATLVEAAIRLRSGESTAAARRLALRALSRQPRATELLLFLALVERLEGHDELALQSINKFFRSENLAEVALTDPTAGLRLGNLQPAVMPASGLEEHPLVSVIMTTFNSAEHVATAVQSVLQQSHSNLELLVIDDGSTDATLPILDDFAARDPRIQVIRNHTNVGTYCAKNRALMLARGDFVTCHDSDDWSHPQKLERQLRSLLARPHLAATISRWVRMDAEGRFVIQRWGRMIYDNPSSLLYRREVIERIGFYDSVRIGADTEFEARIAACYGPGSIGRLPFCLAFGLERTDSLTGGEEFGFDENRLSPLRQRYWAAWSDWHLRCRAEGTRELYLPFPLTERPFAPPESTQVPLEDVRRNLDAAAATGA